jgi:hypothetical protein
MVRDCTLKAPAMLGNMLDISGGRKYMNTPESLINPMLSTVMLKDTISAAKLAGVLHQTIMNPPDESTRDALTVTSPNRHLHADKVFVIKADSKDTVTLVPPRMEPLEGMTLRKAPKRTYSYVSPYELLVPSLLRSSNLTLPGSSDGGTVQTSISPDARGIDMVLDPNKHTRSPKGGRELNKKWTVPPPCTGPIVGKQDKIFNFSTKTKPRCPYLVSGTSRAFTDILTE